MVGICVFITVPQVKYVTKYMFMYASSSSCGGWNYPGCGRELRSVRQESDDPLSVLLCALHDTVTSQWRFNLSCEDLS